MGGGQKDLEGGSRSVRQQAQLAAGIVYDAIREGQAKPGIGANRLGREERLEDPIADGRGNRAQLLAAFLESVRPIPATPAEQAAALTRPEEPKKAEPADVRPVAVAAAVRLTPASFHRSPSAWLDDYYRVLAR